MNLSIEFAPLLPTELLAVFGVIALAIAAFAIFAVPAEPSSVR